MARPPESLRILLVEDEPDVRILLQNVLLAAGYHVDPAENRTSAMALLETARYDLVLTDDRLPDGRGVDIADAARTRGMEAVVVTGYGTRLTRDESARHEYLLKPIRADELVEVVDRTLRASPRLGRGQS